MKMPLMMVITAMPFGAVGAADILPLPEMVTCAIADKQAFQQPDRVHLTGWIGSRMEANEKNRLVKIDPNRLLLSYQNRPGCQSYDGEHIGKWLHAATLAWVNSGDPELRKKLDVVATGLVKWQLEDGYVTEAKTIARVVFIHGKTFNVGDCFDASAGKPRIRIQTQSGGAWEDAGELKDYPATTGDKAGPLKEGESFQCQLAAPVKVFGVRVTGKPSFGGNPNQAFSTCAELQAFAK
ncbi:MAG: glycoside hydrolase family 127 protein [Verrucomicrobia bacterium]|nr:glycoside hydrolase family 127 protein [Verrucomicrobiota bacterium]